MNTFKKWVSIVTGPEDFFTQLKEEGLKASTLFFLLFSVINIVGSFLFILIVPSEREGLVELFGLIPGGTSVGVVLVFIAAVMLSLLLFWCYVGITHLLVLAFGGRKGIQETYRALAYAYAPTVVSFLPFVGFAGAIYSVVLEVIGLSKRQELSILRCVFIVGIPLAIIILAGLALGAFLVYLFFQGANAGPIA